MAEEEAKKVEPQPEPCSEAPPPTDMVESPKDVAEEKTVIPPLSEADDSKALVVVEKPAAEEEKKLEGSINRDAVLARVTTEKRLSLIKAWEESEKSKCNSPAPPHHNIVRFGPPAHGPGLTALFLAPTQVSPKRVVMVKVSTPLIKQASFPLTTDVGYHTKAENKAQKKVSSIGAWENSKKASIEAELKKKEEHLETKKAESIEKLKNKIALAHKAAEEKRAIIEAKRGEDLLKAEETAAKYCATGTAPKKLLGCF